MEDTKHIRISDFDYDLPDGRIAKFPLARRDSSKLLVYFFVAGVYSGRDVDAV